MKQLTLYPRSLTSMRKKERKEREQVIKNFEENVSVMNKKVENLEKELDKHEQYSRRNSVLVHGIAETDDLVIEAISTKRNIEISPADLYRTHRIGKKMPGQNKPRPIIVKLSRYKVRKKVFFQQKKSERVQCKYSRKLNMKTHGNSKEG